MVKKHYKSKRGKTDAEAAQDMKFANAMQRDMEKYSRDRDNRREDFLKDNSKYDGSETPGAGREADFSGSVEERQALMSTMYMPYLGSAAAPMHNTENAKPGLNSEFGDEIEAARAGRQEKQQHAGKKDYKKGNTEDKRKHDPSPIL